MYLFVVFLRVCSHHSTLASVVLTLGLLLLAHSYNLEYLIFVQVLEAGARYDILVVFFGEQKACVLEPLAVECISVLEDIAHVLNRYTLRKYMLALPLNRLHTESVRQLYNINDYRIYYTYR